jgi:hypothetical protein
MTFDELWRRDSPREGAPIPATDTPEAMEIFKDTDSDRLVFDDPDEREINRFIEWLEQSLPSDEKGKRFSWENL